MPCSFLKWSQMLPFFPSEHRIFWILKYTMMTIASLWFTGELLPSTLLTVPFNIKKVSRKIFFYNFYLWPEIAWTGRWWWWVSTTTWNSSHTQNRFCNECGFFYKWVHACSVITGKWWKISYWGMPLSQKISRKFDKWSPVALFGPCWHPFHCWLDKCHWAIKYSCLEDLTQMGLVRLVCLRVRNKPMTFFTDNGIVCHIFHRTAVHCLSLYCTSISFYNFLSFLPDTPNDGRSVSRSPRQNHYSSMQNMKNKPHFFLFFFF